MFERGRTLEEAEGKGKEYGCVFCIKGREHTVARRLERDFPYLRAIAPMKLRNRRVDGALKEEMEILFPGYVFIEVDDELNVRLINGEQDVIRVLFEDDERRDWRLIGKDRETVKILFETGGIVGFSEAYFDEYNKLRIRNGFLKPYEDQITRVNRRARTAEISVLSGSMKTSVWLGYHEQPCYHE